MRANWLNFREKEYLKSIQPSVLKTNGKPILKSIDYHDKNSQSGWALDLVKGGADSCPFICTICQGLPKFPIELKECGDTYCYDCISDFITRAFKICTFRSNIPCPNCKHDFRPEEIELFEAKSRALFRIFTSLNVRCSYGCGLLKGPKTLIEHEMFQCPKRPVNIPNGCSLNGTRLTIPDKEMEVHLESCPSRLVYCNKCHLPKQMSEKKHACVKALTDTIKCMFNRIIQFY